ncbi:MAG: Eco57I restriction-modification methylase domain-containing protein [bacterium]|nr:Eco57I restriction-modification methylase domain-containing protein [bacterium]
MSAPAIIEKLVKQFKADYDSLKHEKEATIRKQFIDKFFAALGWDMENAGGSRSLYRDVIVEDTLESDKAKGVWAPDYSFGIGGDRKFFVEAKRLSVQITKERQSAVQVRRYAWNAKLPIAILTDFEDFIVLDARHEPRETDRADTARLLVINFERYVERWEEIREKFSREAVHDGSFDRWVSRVEMEKPAGLPVNAHFLKSVEEWRKKLAIEIRSNHAPTSKAVLNIKYAVTRIIDRIIFLRVCEARGLAAESDSLLKRTESNPYENLVKCFHEADTRYNSGLFRFKRRQGQIEPPDEITETLKIGAIVTREIIRGLYDERDVISTPYDFRAMSVEVLGQMYEQFLGKTIEIDSTGIVDIVDKGDERARRRKQGVYYTPSYIVRYIVKKTLEPLLKGKTPATLESFRVLDPACGSGSFLLGAYQSLLSWYLSEYEKVFNETGSLTGLPMRRAERGTLQLILEERNRILLDHVFGVDLDAQAVEVTKLSLLLEAIKDEPKSVLDKRTRQGTSALPDLGNNIKCGNSLLGTDYLVAKRLSKTEREQLNCFNWAERFAEADQAGGFDAVIGNPPYVRQETLGTEFKEYVRERYPEVYRGVADLYIYFIQRAHELLKPDGNFGMICSNKWMRASYGKPLRDYLTQKTTIREIVDFGELRVFQDAATFPAIILTQKQTSKEQRFVYAPIKRLDFASLESEVRTAGTELDDRAVSGGNWALAAGGETALFEKMKRLSVPLSDYVQGEIYYGIKTGLNEAFVIDRTTRDCLIAEDKQSKKLIEPFVIGDDIRKYHINAKERYLIFVRHGTDIKQYPAIERHLRKFKKQLQPRPLDWEGKDWPGRKPGPYKWYEIQDNVAYHDKFEQGKIIYPVIAKEPRFSFDASGLYCNDKAFIIPITDMYLLGLLNSRLVWTFLKRLCSVLGDADKGGRLELRRVHLIELPIRRIDLKNREDKAKHKKMVSLVEQILERNRELTAAPWSPDQERLEGEIKALDHEIDELVYNLYGLTEEEIKVVEGRQDRP